MCMQLGFIYTRSVRNELSSGSMEVLVDLCCFTVLDQSLLQVNSDSHCLLAPFYYSFISPSGQFLLTTLEDSCRPRARCRIGFGPVFGEKAIPMDAESARRSWG